MLSYRSFRNIDPPLLLELWNSSAQTRGVGRLAGCDNLEQLVFSKPYFDPSGLVLAFDDDRLVGFVHAGFGADELESRLDRTQGVICSLLVRPEFRRRGIGTELLRRGERFLVERGAEAIYAGSLHPLNPFYLGLYGGSESPGVLETNPEASAFLKARGYGPAEAALVYQRKLEGPPSIDDSRLPLIRREIEILAEPWPMPDTWWQGCTYGPLPTLRYEMLERTTRVLVGQAWAWKMEAFERVAGASMFGLTHLSIRQERRRHGFATLLLQSVLRHLYEEGVNIIEAQTMARNQAAIGLYEKFRFQHVDTGQVYRKLDVAP